MDINLMKDELNDLRSKIDTTTEQHKFKKSMVGGYDCEQVEAYIKSLKKASAQERKLFEEKYEEASSSSTMIMQERDIIAKKLAEAETKISECVEIMTQLETKNGLLDKRIEEFTMELGSIHSTEDLEKKLADVEAENNELSSRLDESLETSAVATSENTVLKDKVQDLSATVERISSENLELKDCILKLKVAKRNIAINASTSIFEYQQKHKYNVERINNSINENLKVLETMRIEMDDLYLQTQKNVSDEQQVR